MSVDEQRAGITASLSDLALPDLGLSTSPGISRGHPGLLDGLAARMTGPGGTYNIGNAAGLLGGLALAVWNMGGAKGVANYLAGNLSAVALTAATVVFFWSGEVYHRAWADAERPDPRLNRQGDLLSAAGAVALAVSLALLGLPLLAATAGVMHALGKLGSALHRPGTPGLPSWPDTWPDPFRSIVLLSRVPATLVAALALAAGLSAAAPLVPILLGPGVLLLCNLVWARADIMLFRPAS